MRTHGTLVKWNDERGFGFIAVASGNEEVFVHLLAFPRDGQRPQVGELVSFEIQWGADGKRKAQHVQRPGQPAGDGRRRTGSGRGRDGGREKPGRWGPTGSVIVLLALVAMVAYATQDIWRPAPSAAPVPLPPTPLAQPLSAGEPFSCDGRTHCSQMRSCAEATYFLKHCPGTQMDGNNDGEPCEQQWCN